MHKWQTRTTPLETGSFKVRHPAVRHTPQPFALLSVVMAVYNEAQTVAEVIQEVLKLDLNDRRYRAHHHREQLD